MVKSVTKEAGLTFVGASSEAAAVTALGTPAAPQGLAAVSAGNGRIDLTWTASAGATQYNVYRYNSTKKAYVYIGTSKTAEYRAEGLTPGTTYYFKVKAAAKGAGLTFVSAFGDAANAKA